MISAGRSRARIVGWQRCACGHLHPVLKGKWEAEPCGYCDDCDVVRSVVEGGEAIAYAGVGVGLRGTPVAPPPVEAGRGRALVDRVMERLGDSVPSVTLLPAPDIRPACVLVAIEPRRDLWWWRCTCGRGGIGHPTQEKATVAWQRHKERG